MYLFSGQSAVSKKEAGLDILPFEKRIVPEQVFDSHASSEVGENVLHGDPHVADDRFAAEKISG